MIFFLFLLNFLFSIKKVCVDRCLERGKASGRTDDNEESLKKRYKKRNLF